MFDVKSCRSLAVQRDDEAGLPRESPDNPHVTPPDMGVFPHALLPAGVGRGLLQRCAQPAAEGFPWASLLADPFGAFKPR